MNRHDILNEIDAVLVKGNTQLLDKLRPGLDRATIERLTKGITGKIEPLFDLYAWHDGTDFVRLASGETFEKAMARIAMFPGASFHFLKLELAMSYVDLWRESAKRRPNLKELATRYFTLFFDGADAFFLLDLNARSKSEVAFFRNDSDSPPCPAYSTLDDFLSDILEANKTGKPLRFFRNEPRRRQDNR